MTGILNSNPNKDRGPQDEYKRGNKSN
jgi:hypothetical protein